MKTLFVMDPLDTINIDGDSTYALMVELTRRECLVYMTTPKGLYIHKGVGGAFVKEVKSYPHAPYFEVIAEHDLSLSQFDVVWMRKDPPFDMSYIRATYVLDCAGGALVINDPKGLKLFNEKLWAMRFVDLHPPTLFSSNADQIRQFAEEHASRVVLKPWDGNGGRGVLVTHIEDRNINSMIELLTNEGNDPILIQPFLEGISKGDKRVLLFDGEPVGAMMRIPSSRDYRGNMHVGATVEACELSDRDMEICRALKPELKKWGQLFVGIDIIDGYLTEINVTSPTGIHEINRLNGANLESDLITLVEKKCEERSG